MNRSIYIYSFGCENYIKFVSMEVKNFDFREEKKMMKDAQEEFGMLKKKNCMGYLLSFNRRFK